MFKVSVVMAVYNNQKYLKDAIDSILQQTFTDFEFIIINDGSTDDSEKLILSYNDPRIMYLKNSKNMGLAASLNKAIKLAKGEYIARMDADDIAYPERFAKQVKFLDNNKDYGVIGSWVKRFGALNKVIKYPAKFTELFYRFILGDGMVAHPAVMFKKSVVIDNNIFYDESLNSAQDYKFFNDLKHLTKLTNLQEVLLDYRTHAESVSSHKKQQQFENMLNLTKFEYQKALKIEFKPEFISLIKKDFANLKKSEFSDFLQMVGNYLSFKVKLRLIKSYLRSKMKSKYDIVNFIKNFDMSLIKYLVKK